MDKEEFIITKLNIASNLLISDTQTRIDMNNRHIQIILSMVMIAIILIQAVILAQNIYLMISLAAFSGVLIYCFYRIFKVVLVTNYASLSLCRFIIASILSAKTPEQLETALEQLVESLGKYSEI